MSGRWQRLIWALGVLAALVAVGVLVFNAFRSNLVFFFTPSQVAQGAAPLQRPFRLGGLVREGSVVREGVAVRFVVTDLQRDVPVRFEGVLPDLFKPGKGVVAQGQLGADGVFVAREVLAKHDENYMPPEAAEALRRAASEPLASPTLKPAPR
jgi:cytochrome c-type biogenesis protein CcmE